MQESPFPPPPQAKERAAKPIAGTIPHCPNQKAEDSDVSTIADQACCFTIPSVWENEDYARIDGISSVRRYSATAEE
jgi:hypothetical protein